MKEVTLDDWEREVLKSDILAVVEFWATWCPWCKKLNPVVDELAKDYAGKIRFFRVNVEQNQKLAETYGITGLPTMKLFCSGRTVGEILGYLPKDALKQAFDNALSVYRECLERSSPLII